MTRQYTFHDQASHPDEWFCSTEQKWKPRSEFNLRDEANGLPQWDCRDCQQKRKQLQVAVYPLVDWRGTSFVRIESQRDKYHGDI